MDVIQATQNHIHEESQRGTYIPFRRADVIEMCLTDGKLNEEEQVQFRTFCRMINAFYHFHFHSIQENLKENFAVMDLDSDCQPFFCLRPESRREKIDAFFEDFQHILLKANFHPLSREQLVESFRDRSLIDLNIHVDFDMFERFLCFYRGSRMVTARKRVYPLYYRNITFEALNRVVLLVRFKDRAYFEEKGIKPHELQFVPGQTYLFYFKNVPKADLEIIFPNVKISMTLKDKLLFLVPAVSVGMSTLLKISANLIMVTGFIIFMIGLRKSAERFGVTEEVVQNSLIPMIAALASVSLILGGFAIKQYLNYKNKWVEFLNDVTQALFFRCIGINTGVFQCLIDAAEEEECKEAILAYYHLLTSGQKLTKEELDRTIEQWLAGRFGVTVNFDVEDALTKLRAIEGRVVFKDQVREEIEKESLIRTDENGVLRVPPLRESLMILDSIWDNFFQYNEFRPAAEMK